MTNDNKIRTEQSVNLSSYITEATKLIEILYQCMCNSLD